MRPFDPATRVQDYLVFGEFGDVNPSITDSSTYTFLRPASEMEPWRGAPIDDRNGRRASYLR